MLFSFSLLTLSFNLFDIVVKGERGKEGPKGKQGPSVSPLSSNRLQYQWHFNHSFMDDIREHFFSAQYEHWVLQRFRGRWAHPDLMDTEDLL